MVFFIFHHLGFKYPALRVLYEEANQRAESICKIIMFVGIYMGPPAAILPIAVHSYFKYFTMDLGPDAFELSILLW